MECQNSLIEKNGEEDIEMAAKRVTVYKASPECKVSGIVLQSAGLVLALHYPNAKLVPVALFYLNFSQKGPKWDKWKQNGITVAGGKGYGQQLNQLGRPEGIFIDKNKNIFIADSLNHRIVEWKYNAKKGQIIAGGNGRGDRMDQLDRPTDVFVGQKNHSIIIADRSNRRVIECLNKKQQILIHNIDCSGLAMDKHGFLYVSDGEKNEVRRWK
ncbi:unnamed protein product, partial [Adineta steineri]